MNRNFKLKAAMDTLTRELYDAKEYGSILNVSMVDFPALYARFEEIKRDNNIISQFALIDLLPFVQIAEAMAQKYDVVVTNPPYMNGSGMSTKLLEYVQRCYPNEKSDLYACFISKALKWSKHNRFVSMITMETWMFLNSLERMRANTLEHSTIESLVHMPYLGKGGTSLGINFGTAAYVLATNSNPYYSAEYNYICYYDCDDEGVPFRFPLNNERHRFTQQKVFSTIPGTPVAYWVSLSLSKAFSHKRISSEAISDGQTKTGDNNTYLRLLWEISKEKIGKKEKWAFIAKGGNFRRWYGNIEYVIDWSTTARNHYRKDRVARIAPEYIWFREGVSWNHVTSIERFAARYLREDMLFETAAPSIFFADKNSLLWVIGYLNSIVSEKILKIINPTMCTNVGDITIQPMANDDTHTTSQTINLVEKNIELSKQDWDSFETSWDFRKHPLVPLAYEKKEQEDSQWGKQRMESFGKVQWHFENWQQEAEARFKQLKANEEELNRIFIDIYGLQDELTPEVEDKDVTVRKADLGREIRSLISYAVGCMFGRYSLDVPSLVYAGGVWDASKYKTFLPDEDNVLPICDDEYFEDDIVARFIKFIETAYGKESLEENLKFIADALGGKGTPRQVIRNYFLNDFYADHLKIYQKRPIYWLFDSGKKNGFKCLIYMHRYQPDTIARIRTDYVHEQQERYRSQIQMIEDAMQTASTAERVKLNKQLTKFKDQALELQKYEEKIHHLADQAIPIDLDDGVKVNYAKFEDVLAKIK